MQTETSYPFFIEQFRQHAKAFPENLAVRVDDVEQGYVERSYGELLVRAERIAFALREKGCQPGDRVVVIGRPSMPWIEVMLGAMCARCAFAPFSTALTTDEQKALLVDAEPTIIFADREFVEQGACAEEKTFLLDSLDEWLAHSLGDTEFNNKEFNHREQGGEQVHPQADDLFSIIYSSGTTGVPKGIAHTNAGRSDFIGARPRPGFGPGRVALVCTSLYTNFSFLGILTPLYYGAAVSIMSRFTVEGFLRVVEEQGISDVSLVPVQLKRILEHADFNANKITSLQFTMISGSPVDLTVKEKLAELWPGRIVDSYGTTETGGIATLSLKDDVKKLDTVGKILPGVDAAILGDDDQPLPLGEVGEIAAHTPMPMTGYYNRDELTANLSWKNDKGKRYIKTGDVGFIDDDGYLHITGRSKDMIISGGLNIYASDIEAALCEHSAVDEAAVIAIPDERWGETPYAIVVLREGAGVTTDDLQQWLEYRLARTSRPAGIDIVAALPRNDMGKVLKRVLREPFWKNNERGVA